MEILAIRPVNDNNTNILDSYGSFQATQIRFTHRDNDILIQEQKDLMANCSIWIDLQQGTILKRLKEKIERKDSKAQME